MLIEGTPDDSGVAILRHAALATEPGTVIRFQAGSWHDERGWVSPVVERQSESTEPDEETDTDQDGLSDTDEVQAGTDVHRADTDGDGLSDGDEVHVHKTNPLRFDSDSDGLTDTQELQQFNTDPNDADSDDDALSDGKEAELGTDPNEPDSDGDRLLDGAEVSVYGTDPTDDDSDGDGVTDDYEILLGSNPMVPEAIPTPWPWDVGNPEASPDCDGDGIPNKLDPEICNGVDDDCDGFTDEGFNAGDSDGDGVLDCLEAEDCDCVDDDGDGLVAEHCKYEVTATVASSQGGFSPSWNGISVPGTHSDPEVSTTRVLPARPNAFGVHTNAITTPPEFRISIRANGQLIAASGDAAPWIAFNPPVTGWDAYGAPGGAADVATGGGCYTGWNTPLLDADGAQVLRFDNSAGCSVPGVHSLRIRTDFELCGAIEVCDGTDNDGDGLIDDGVPDADGDGICDRFDWEECDNIDNDGDGLTDEDVPNTDSDGLCDLRDVETCDGMDNDGDGQTDEGPDLNLDGISDCLQDPCSWTTEPLMAATGMGAIRSADVADGTYTELGHVNKSLTGITVTPDSGVYAIGPSDDHAVLYQIAWESPPRLEQVAVLGPYVEWPPYNGAIEVSEDGNLYVAWDDSIYHYDLASGALTLRLQDTRLEQIRDLT